MTETAHLFPDYSVRYHYRGIALPAMRGNENALDLVMFFPFFVRQTEARGYKQMINTAAASRNVLHEGAPTEKFLEALDEESFAVMFKTFTPLLVAFFRARGCKGLAEDLAQEVMLTVHRKAGQVRDRASFRAWVFTIARNDLCRYWGQHGRELKTVDIAEVPGRLIASNKPPEGAPAFEFRRWMAFLDSREREVMTLRFIEEWEYHEIAAAQSIPIGTAQWLVFNAKKKLAPHLKRTESTVTRKAA